MLSAETVLVLVLDQAVGGSDGRASRVRICPLCRAKFVDIVSLTERDNGCAAEDVRLGCPVLELRELADVRRESTSEEIRRVKGDGASSSSLSLQPSPVVRPMPPRSRVPSRCLTRRFTVSRWSLKIPDLVITDAAVPAGH